MPIHPAEPLLFTLILKLITAVILIFIVYLQVGVGLIRYSQMMFDTQSKELKLRPFVFNFVFSAAFSLLYLSESIVLSSFAYGFTFLTFSVFITYEKLHSSGKGFHRWLSFELGDANTILMEAGIKGAVGGAFSSFGPVIYRCTMLAAAYTLLIWLIVNLIDIRISSLPVALVPIIALCLGYVATNRSGAAINYFPVVLKVPFQFYAAAILPVYRGKRDAVSIPLDNKAPFERLIYIVDESIRGDKLSINDCEINNTPWLQEMQHRLFNYGIACSVSNSSAPSNIMLQTGTRPSEVAEAGIVCFKKTSIFQYAQHAGYKTIYIDGQGLGSMLLNHMRSADFDSIDLSIQIRQKYPGINRHDIDMKIADEIISLFEQYPNEKLFFYVLKSGVHFPYECSFPVEDPEIAKGIMEKENHSDDSVRQLRLNYYSSIKWNVDDFLKKLVPAITEYDPTIIYTSDHGECLREDGSYITHAIYNGSVYQGMVPLMVIPLGNSYDRFFALAHPHFKHNINKASHFNIFATILLMMGYNTKAVADKYEPGLFDKLDGMRSFYSEIVPGSSSYYETKVNMNFEKVEPS